MEFQLSSDIRFEFFISCITHYMIPTLNLVEVFTHPACEKIFQMHRVIVYSNHIYHSFFLIILLVTIYYYLIKNLLSLFYNLICDFKSYFLKLFKNLICDHLLIFDPPPPIGHQTLWCK